VETRPEKLLQQPDPRLDMMVVREASKRSAQSSSTFGKHRTVQLTGPTCLISLRRQGETLAENIRAGRRVGKTFYSIAPHTGLHSGERAWRNVNPYHGLPSPRI
jgi:hypothetical protein